MRLVRFGVVIVILLVGVSGSFTSAQDGGSVSHPASEVFDFPRDHLLHQNDLLMNENYI